MTRPWFRVIIFMTRFCITFLSEIAGIISYDIFCLSESSLFVVGLYPFKISC